MSERRTAGRGFRDRTFLALVALTGVALLSRVVFLGDRIAHWDEGRVGYDILRYMATGAWEYRPIVHGPFLPHVNKYVFALVGADDFTMRLVVAIVGGLMPLGVWLYRERLRDAEMVAVGLFLTVDPILVYYSRFMRNDVLLAAFMFFAVGLFIRLVDTGRLRYLFAGTGALALAFTTKENAVVYVLIALGTLALLLDHRLFLARERREGWTAVALQRLGSAGRGIWRLKVPLAVALLEFLVIFVFFYAPRGGPGGIGLWRAFAQPSMFPDVIAAATYNPAPCTVPAGTTPHPFCDGAFERAVSTWVTGGLTDNGYLSFLGHYLEALGSASGPLVLLAVFGFVTDRYRGGRPRDLISAGFYWGLVTVLGYPVIVDIRAAWSVTHAIVPFAIPAAAGAVLLYDWGRDALAKDDRVSVGLVAVILLIIVGQMAVTTVSTSYVNPQSEGNVIVQFAQPEGEMRPALRAVHRAARDNDGLDVLWYGEHFLVENESAAYRLPIADGEWYNRLPLPWYLERSGATVNSTDDPDRLRALVEDERPPVVITRVEERGDINASLSGYRESTYELRQFQLEVVFYIDEEYASG